MRYRKISVAVCLLLSLTIISCGGTAPAPKAPDYSTIDGNWLMTGVTSNTLNFTQGPYVGAALAVSGTSIYGQFQIELRCADGSMAGLGFPNSGTIQSDGSFTLNSPVALPSGSSLQFELDGKVPAKNSNSWGGSYSLHLSLQGPVGAPSPSTCTFDQNGSFNAVAYSPIQGSFSGSVSNYLGSTFAVNLQISQLTPTVGVARAGQSTVITPISGAITVTGSPCFASGTVQSGSISGDQFFASVLMDDGTTASLHAYLGDTTSTVLQEAFLIRLPTQTGNCAGQSLVFPLLKQH